MFFEGIFLEIEDYGLGEGLLNHVIFWMNILNCALRAVVILFVYLHALYFMTLSVFRIYTIEL